MRRPPPFQQLGHLRSQSGIGHQLGGPRPHSLPGRVRLRGPRRVETAASAAGELPPDSRLGPAHMNRDLRYRPTPLPTQRLDPTALLERNPLCHNKKHLHRVVACTSRPIMADHQRPPVELALALEISPLSNRGVVLPTRVPVAGSTQRPACFDVEPLLTLPCAEAPSLPPVNLYPFDRAGITVNDARYLKAAS